jgi:hypothetical protein
MGMHEMRVRIPSRKEVSHLAAIVALTVVIPFFAVAAHSQPATSNSPARQGGRNNQQTAQPPIHVTVTTPEPSPETTKRQEDREERNVTAQEDVRDFTRALTVLTFIQAVIALVALVLSFKATSVATRSADVAEKSLRLLNQPWLDTADWKMTPELAEPVHDDLGGYTQELTGLALTFNVVNNSRTPAILQQIDVEHFGMDVSFTPIAEHMLTPDGTYPYTVHIISLTFDQIGRCKHQDGLRVEVRGAIKFVDWFGPSVRTRYFGRKCILRRYGQSEFHYIAGAERVEPQSYHHKEQG